MAKKATTTKKTPVVKKVKQESVQVIKEVPEVKAVQAEVSVPEVKAKSFKDFDDLIYRAITSKIFPGVDMNKLYKEYLESNIGSNDNIIVNWAIKKLI